jgi:hypothetical protein
MQEEVSEAGMDPEQQLRERMREAAATIRPAGDPLEAIEHRATSIRRRRATLTAGALVIAVTAASLVTSTRSAGGESPPAAQVATDESTATYPRTTNPAAAGPRTTDPASADPRTAGTTAAQPRTTESTKPRTTDPTTAGPRSYSLPDDPSSANVHGAGGSPWAAGFPARTTTQFLASKPETLSWAVDRQNRTTDVGVLVPGDSIWLLYSCAPGTRAMTFLLQASPTGESRSAKVVKEASCTPETALEKVKVPTGWYLTSANRMRILDFE